MIEELESAIDALSRLLSAANVAEDDYQTYFEDHSIVFKTLGYVEFLSKPRLYTDDTSYLEPDFMLKRPNGLFEIWDLKLDNVKIIKGKKNRNTFYAPVHEYISQVSEYSEYFDDSAHRDLFREKHGHDVQKHPEPFVVLGRNTDLDFKELHKLTDRAGIKLVTYDDILTNLYNFYSVAFEIFEKLPGASLHTTVHLRPYLGENAKKKYFYDCGAHLDKERVSVYVDEQGLLCFRLIDSNSNTHLLEIDRDLSEKCYKQMSYLAFEFGTTDKLALIQVLLDGQVIARRDFRPGIALPQKFDLQQYILFMDKTHKYSIPCSMMNFRVWERTFSLQERLAMTDHYLDEISPKCNQPGI
ncbi:MAG: DUF4263 domain-containing protein [Proteobacteria bacterium]|nr:DUF4263 domain-containing protein [Pseudomonadota bacterium]